MIYSCFDKRVETCQKDMMMLNYDIVIATRNRASFLALSIPLMLGQSRPPVQLIVVDSSDDHGEVRSVVEKACAGSPVPWKVIHSERGLTMQRNIGLQEVKSQVVMYPDDDAMWLPGTAEAIMRIYERDTEGHIGAVCAAESLVPPREISSRAADKTPKAKNKTIFNEISNWFEAIDQTFFPDPFHVHGRSKWNVRPKPEWLAEENAVLVEYMTGFRMSFRTEVIRKYRFDENLFRYALNEDLDASFAVMAEYLVVGARNARVYHHKAPGKREDGLTLGVFALLNRTYVLCKHAEPGSRARRCLKRFAWFKLLRYLFGIHSEFGRQRVFGTWRAMRAMAELMNASREELPHKYKALFKKCLGE